MNESLSLWLTADRPLNIAHRGASAAAPPNTLAAFRRAVELGADGVELDAHLSADGAVVVIHDFTVDGTTDGSGRVAEMPLAALKALDAGARFDPAFAGERIPTLDEVFAAVGQQLLINVELKTMSFQDSGLERRVVERVQRHGLAERVLLSSFNPFAIRRARRLDPRLPVGFLYEASPVSALARLLAALMADRRPDAVHPHWMMVRPATVRRAHRRGQRVVTWTVDDPQMMRRLADWGVDAIITNHPDRLRDVLKL